MLSNPRMPSLLKIGFTVRDVAGRAAELSTGTGVPAAFVVEAYFPSQDPQTDETAVHNALDAHRVPGKEFFSIGCKALG